MVSLTTHARRILATSGKAYKDPTKHTGSKPGKDKAADAEGACWRIAALSDYENGFFDGANFEDCYVCFVDPSNYENAPGWMLRNLLVLVKHRWGLSKIQVLRYRDVHSKRDQGRSIVVTLAEKNQPTLDLKAPDHIMPKVTGWERNPTGKLTGRLVDLTEYLDPQRQPLFNFKDCLEGGAKKAHRASQALSDIYPGVESTGYALSVPMAGHPVLDAEKTRREFEQLERLICEHDVIFLLMDTRESRWLPTVMGKAAGKIVMNAALGFDSFVVMRHGVKVAENPAAELGCYFCNDIVAPTLDQQCTVTRPGVAAIASALLVELLISILQHPLGAAAPAPASRNDDRGSHPLGLVPHQIRGFLSTFENLCVVGRSYKCCSACSETIVDTYKEKGWDFVQKALNETGYVENLSGLKEVGTPVLVSYLLSCSLCLLP
ncbi:unnamed protein product [Aspergillus oryzae]|uniref:Unnamed protein product n=2 Tax=Aspergillus oryzae TaxID=5062 RepID=A0AAN4YVL0_ASPOZ|nr:unnamed protein product [Aspergillus oryzae]GMF97210.1 unnamed protein product [Aspergillus oryzae]GMG13990.1 unnamed protein product [Aspergillus oryzae]GMG38444.1 unnamed protein product [Aspergillus oryzae]GMG54443.1 unnamed protein product [Aspergillus oryzae var. brunneus]